MKCFSRSDKQFDDKIYRRLFSIHFKFHHLKYGTKWMNQPPPFPTNIDWMWPCGSWPLLLLSMFKQTGYFSREHFLIGSLEYKISDWKKRERPIRTMSRGFHKCYFTIYHANLIQTIMINAIDLKCLEVIITLLFHAAAASQPLTSIHFSFFCLLLSLSLSGERLHNETAK